MFNLNCESNEHSRGSITRQECRKFRRTKLTAPVRVTTLWPKQAKLSRVILSGSPRIGRSMSGGKRLEAAYGSQEP
ncbi:hypothetical protein OUZ56_029860 [Daphnia magna]|uniref:Uncharacterized protein n=1 Tax=Daphnia magna TaxID=35525 RepID=A0ABR0B835_9CRUS|nr:hypothetical protein OUZ56_029860 [Daphnia magna]